jgi:hypothetical protein
LSQSETFSALTGAKSKPYFGRVFPLFSNRTRARYEAMHFANLTVKTFSCHKSRWLLSLQSLRVFTPPGASTFQCFMHERMEGQGPVNKHGDGYTSACMFSSALTLGQSSVLPSPSDSYSDRSPRIRLVSVIVFQLLAVAIRLLNCRNPSAFPDRLLTRGL